MSLPALPTLDRTLARCPKCAGEAVWIVGTPLRSLRAQQLSLRCERCLLTEPLGYTTPHSRYLFPWVMRRWGVSP
ncbi:hypothetical protein Dgeo_1362 [Deinococcus geothermalis DSM 11300]|uniref:Uncharacterized protein n=1 Tax=Deinococcus geothermalis (strain DSM 11300 / CIP 105573 / AG-3a) TaxID=319795 RepID=Q1IYM7_DEIGD|nr:hypothetical protein [Deinococcus geothermalis]ABF45657.1 hypothetical protein Dgeo_1362 [Deinococcus geothermalis DSM 11300]